MNAWSRSVGVIGQVGLGVTTLKVCDQVPISCITSCGRCEYCRRQVYSPCARGGWILGKTIDGTQAKYVRIPHAETSLYPISARSDEEALVMLSDILPTGFECGLLNGKVQLGSSVAIVAAGPIGLAALMTAQFVLAVQRRHDRYRQYTNVIENRPGGKARCEAADHPPFCTCGDPRYVRNVCPSEQNQSAESEHRGTAMSALRVNWRVLAGTSAAFVFNAGRDADHMCTFRSRSSGFLQSVYNASRRESAP